ncbi:MAG TPA: hypothetical protein PKN96_02165 [Flavobacterium sp.]|uniref:hypothetical protein n=1 Tax=Flavobacterium sp. TaxID=239 RepID=UPI002C0DDC5B|nr:hypothetical protein [Flavobacterium sp.]HNP32078.1 hypothetical protein [Flavobacterium sp.]
MKKRLEAELISIAHRILKLKNKSDVDQLYKETQKLYETLAVLKFYQDNFESVKSDVSEEVLDKKLEKFNEEKEVEQPVAEVKEKVVDPVAEVETEEETQEQIIVSEEPEQVLEEEQSLDEEDSSESDEEEVVEDEEPQVKEELAFKPIFELEVEDEEEVDSKDNEQTEEKLEDYIGKYTDPVFVKPDEVSLFPSETPAETREEIKTAIPAEEPRTSTLNDVMSKSIAIGLNDRIGFVQHLFNDSNEDFNRVISQLNTFDTFEEAKNFINEMVIPDYNYWVGEEDYIERFMAIVEKKFQ